MVPVMYMVTFILEFELLSRSLPGIHRLKGKVIYSLSVTGVTILPFPQVTRCQGKKYLSN